MMLRGSTALGNYGTFKEVISGKLILVTGGAGFIGSHLVERLIDLNVNVRVIDNLSTGDLRNLKGVLGKRNFAFFKGDLLNLRDVKRAIKEVNMVFHLAANPDVKMSSINPEIHINQNILATYNLLKELMDSEDVEWFVFTSTSTVYGEASILPTPENYCPLKPISVYGATKLACEALITAFSHYNDMKASIFRLANIIGPRLNHGVICDFIEKLRINNRELEILGDGQQSKSFLYIDDAIDAIVRGVMEQGSQVEVYNVGSLDRVTVKEIADIVVEEMGLEGVKYKFKRSYLDGRGWKGDVKIMQLSVDKLMGKGWKPRFNSSESVRKTVRELLGKENTH